MKKCLLLMAMLLPLLAFGQEVKFMGLSLGTNVDVFCKTLKSKGLKQTIDGLDRKEFEGTFATYPGCRIIIKSTPVSKKVVSAEVIFESVRNDEYKRDVACAEIVKQYRNKYGDKLIEDKKDNGKVSVLAIHNWNIDNGDVKVTITKSGPDMLSPDECSLSIFYRSPSLQHLRFEEEKNSKQHSDDI